ncbi:MULTISPECIES: hypothetical protein [unclassified Aureispira]|uniref:hypothetical protein n=1 Tax=unclassified Aureispira TaxID=2649989 RepID=UPI000698613B|nr:MULTISPECIES: hypothetical protein [unclassified Aureispira]WMX12640.1 hypothetical protein QP953_17555 [Aureispira sp. CCB-E]
MKKLLLTWVIVLLTFGLGWAQTENTFVQTFIPEEDCYFAVFALNANATVNTWDEPTIKITYTLKNLPEANNTDKVFHQVEMQFYEEERVMIFELPNQDKAVLNNAEKMVEFLEVEILIPNGIKYHVVPTALHPLL